MDKWTRIYVRWAGNKQKVRRAISSIFSAVPSFDWVATAVGGRTMLPSQRRKGNKSIGILLQLILSSLHFPTSQHDLSAEEGKNLSASKFVCIKDLVSGLILLQAVDKLQLLRIFNKLNMVIQKAYLHITTH